MVRYASLTHPTIPPISTISTMAILIANIGTSDLTVNVDNYYFPIGFDRNEPNIDYSGLTPDEDAAWQSRREFVEQILCQELNVEPFTFRNLTHKLRDAYQQQPEAWHSRIRPGRIWGTLVEAQEKFKVRTVYIFITDQRPEHRLDSVYLFDILNQWFRAELGDTMQLIPVPIPATVSAIDQDGLLYEYYQFFSQLNPQEELLISIKGGTPQMQTALRVQAMSSEIGKQLFIEPHLSIKNVLAGKYSDCHFISYWQYRRTQTYQTVKLLLDKRWDFNGTVEILKAWKRVLKFLKPYISDQNLVADHHRIAKVIQNLDIAIHCFNLDSKTVNQSIQSSQLQLSSQLVKQVSSYNRLLNLYTQCRIYWKLNQVANFLTGMSSFYEETLYQVNQRLNPEAYFVGDLQKWHLDTEVMRREMGEELWEWFKELDDGHCAKLHPNNLRRQPRFQLMNRYLKRNFIQVLVKFRNLPEEDLFWQEMLTLLKRLDYWAIQRNHLIHSSEGVSKQRMWELWHSRSPKDADACQPNHIQSVMSQILENGFGIVEDEWRQQFVGDQAKYYIYSEVKDWTIEQLLGKG